MNEKKLIPIEIMGECEDCEKVLTMLNNVSDSRNIDEIRIYLRREFGETKWHISGLNVDGTEILVDIGQ